MLLIFAAMLSGCSLAGPSSRSFTPAVIEEKGDSKTSAERGPARTKADSEECRNEAKLRGISSVLAIIRSADKRNTDADYIACMQKRGYRVEGETAVPEGQTR